MRAVSRSHGVTLWTTAAALVLLPALRPEGAGPPPRAGRPGLVFDPPVVDLGVLPIGREARIEVPWRRTGPGDLHVLALGTGRGVQAAGIPGLVREGASGRLRLRLAPRPRPGPFVLEVRVLAPASPSGGGVLRLRGHVGDLSVSRPSQPDLGARRMPVSGTGEEDAPGAR